MTGEVKLGEACSLEGNYDKPRQCIIKKQRCHCADKGTYRQSYGFSNNHVWMWELDCKEGWVPKNWCFQIAVLGKTLERPLYCNEIKPVNLKENQPWTFIRRTDAEASTPWPPDAGKDWGQKKTWVAEDEMIREDEKSQVASLTEWTWIWANSGRWVKGRQSCWAAAHGLQRVGLT